MVLIFWETEPSEYLTFINYELNNTVLVNIAAFALALLRRFLFIYMFSRNKRLVIANGQGRGITTYISSWAELVLSPHVLYEGFPQTSLRFIMHHLTLNICMFSQAASVSGEVSCRWSDKLYDLEELLVYCIAGLQVYRGREWQNGRCWSRGEEEKSEKERWRGG